MQTPYLPRVAGIPVLPALPGWLAFTQGNIWHVRPNLGLDIRSGKSTVQAFKTLATLIAATGGPLANAGLAANQNDVALMYGENDQVAASTTDYQSATLNWSKDLTHLVGVNGGAPMSLRSRIAFASAYVGVGPLVTVSGNGCCFANLELFMGVASVNPIGCLNVTGSRNRFANCHIAGIGNAANDVAGNYSLKLSGQENYFKGCVIGLNTVSRGAGDNWELLLSGGQNNIFEDCTFLTWASVNTHHFVKRAANTTDRFVTFKNCSFQNFDVAGATMQKVFDVAASTGSPAGLIDLDPRCWFSGAVAWEAAGSPSGIVRAATGVAAAASATSGGRAVAVTGA